MPLYNFTIDGHLIDSFYSHAELTPRDKLAVIGTLCAERGIKTKGADITGGKTFARPLEPGFH